MRQTDKFTFFFGKADVFSNWHEASFEYRGHKFNCVEQFMMYSKARLFNDHEIAEKIMATKDQKEQKALGRLVKNFDGKVWDEKCLSIVTVGCREKFSQNPKLLQALIATGDRVLVEASPYDKIWGIGLSENDPNAQLPEKWKGQNLLGVALTNVRKILLDRVNSVGLTSSNMAGISGGGLYSGIATGADTDKSPNKQLKPKL